MDVTDLQRVGVMALLALLLLLTNAKLGNEPVFKFLTFYLMLGALGATVFLTVQAVFF